MKEINKLLRKKRSVYVTRRVHFNAAHRLFNPNFSDEKNEAVFDICNNIHGHGHNYELEVTLVGTPDKQTGYLFDLKILKRILEEEIISKVDHKHLNFDVEMFKDTIPTAEVIAITFWDVLEKKIRQIGQRSVKLYEIKLYETERNIITFRGGE